MDGVLVGNRRPLTEAGMPAPGVVAGQPAEGVEPTLYVIAEQVDGWRIVAGQNMAVDPQAV
ncbi:hypothetical protein PXH67_42555 (plasmid) [Streptomyces sp. P8-A8]|uniref:hypothetical protein n=1 Tax=Streptomyces sp. P8-A8 TaxID=3029759 RepID=UPI0036DA4027